MMSELIERLQGTHMKFIPLLMLISSCTMDGGDITSEHELARCTDTRDGETFTIISSTARNARIGIGAPTCIDIDDTDGRTRTMCSNQEAWIKCVPVPMNPNDNRGAL